MQDELTPREIGLAIRRHWRLVAGVALAGTMAAAGAALAWPPVYSATARILVEGQQIPAELARSTVTAGPAERLQLIEERLMTRKALLEIADRKGLHADPGLSTDDRVAAMRTAARMQPVALDRHPSSRTAAAALAFTISFSARRAEDAAAVTNEFASRLFEQSRDQRTSRAAGTHAFFRREVERLGAELARTEERIGSFKNANAAALPDGIEIRQKELQDLRARAFQREEERLELTGQLHELTDAIGRGAGAALPDTPEARELARLEGELAERRAVLAPSHPGLRALAARVEALRASQSGPDGAAAGDGEHRALQHRADRIEARLALLDEQEQADEERRAALEAANARAPEVESTLTRLTRRMADLEAQHATAVRKRAEAATGEKLELDRQGERVEVIEWATVPERPDSPNRPLIAAGGAGASLVLGLALALFAQFSGTAIRDRADLERHLGLRPLAVIPVIGRGGVRASAAVVFAVGLAGAGAAPADVGWGCVPAVRAAV